MLINVDVENFVFISVAYCLNFVKTFNVQIYFQLGMFQQWKLFAFMCQKSTDAVPRRIQ